MKYKKHYKCNTFVFLFFRINASFIRIGLKFYIIVHFMNIRGFSVAFDNMKLESIDSEIVGALEPDFGTPNMTPEWHKWRLRGINAGLANIFQEGIRWISWFWKLCYFCKSDSP